MRKKSGAAETRNPDAGGAALPAGVFKSDAEVLAAIAHDFRTLELLELVRKIERDVKRVRAYPLFPVPARALDRALDRLRKLQRLLEQ